MYLKKKIRLDEYLVEQDYFENLDKAKRNIMVGNVIVDENKKEKPGEIIDRTKIKSIRIKDKTCPYVSRGGFKLEKAIENFKINFKDKIVLDIGASTGGFTDCSLKYGAKFVYAVDVGTNQLDWKLRNNKNIKSIENKHINDLKLSDLEGNYPDIIVMDVSFISIKNVLPALKKFMKNSIIGIFLIKPQFEVEKHFLEKGIVTNLEQHKKVLIDMEKYFNGKELFFTNITVSPIKGAKGNTEYLVEVSLEENKKINNLELVVRNMLDIENK